LGCETSRLPHFPDNRLTDEGEVVSLTRRPPFTPRKFSGTHFCQRLSRTQGHSAAGRIRSIEKSNDLVGNRNRDLPACSIMLKLTTLPRAPKRAVSTSSFTASNDVTSLLNHILKRIGRKAYTVYPQCQPIKEFPWRD
jgi:hypothetical protein